MVEEFEVFDEELRKMVRDALKMAEKVKKEIARAKQAGLDVTELEKMLMDSETQLRRISQVYGGIRRAGGGT